MLSLTGRNAGANTVLRGVESGTSPELDQLVTALNNAGTTEEREEVLESVQADVSAGGFTGTISSVTSALNVVGSQIGAAGGGGAPTNGISSGDHAEGLRFWGQAFGAVIDQDERRSVAGFDADTVGMAFGVDTENFHDDLIAGVALSYATTNVESDAANNAKTDVASYQVSLYGEYSLSERTYVRGMAAYGHHKNDTTRNPTAGLTANGEFDADTYTVRASLGHEYDAGQGVTLSPSVMTHWTHYKPDGYTETGAGGANLTVDADALNVIELGVGVTASRDFTTDSGGVLIPEVRVGVRHDFVGDQVANTSSFTGGGSTFESQGADPAQTTFALGTGLTYYDTQNWELRVDYDFEAKEDYTYHSGVARASFRF